MPYRLPPSQEELQEAWSRPEGAKASALRLGVSYTELRSLWIALYGEPGYRERCKRVQALAAAEQARKMSEGRVYKDVPLKCSSCQKEVLLKANQVAQLEVEAFQCESCRFGMACPFCGQAVVNPRGLASHFRHQSATHPDYEIWSAAQKWEGKIEGQDYVKCLECGLRAPALTGHLRTHGLTADAYRLKYGSGALLRTPQSADLRSSSLKAARSSDSYRGLKTSQCSRCGVRHEIPRASRPTLCSSCKTSAEALRWEDLTVTFDYVECVECGYRAENLTSHIYHAHPNYRRDHPDAVVVALKSPVRDKTLLRGRPISEETRQKMSDLAGRWNAGLTADTDERVARSAEAIRKTYVDGRNSWSKGLTMRESPILQRASKAQMETKRRLLEESPTFLKEDFLPYLDAGGRVDRVRASSGLGVSHPTVTYWVKHWGLTYRTLSESISEGKIIRLTSDDLLKFRIGKGPKISLRKAAQGLGVGDLVIRREAQRHGIIIQRGRYKQGLCLATLSEALGGLTYQEEWSHPGFRNPDTDHRFRYDGFFAEIGLVAEFHGYQHYTFPNAYHKTEAHFRNMQQRDAMKRGFVDQTPTFTYFKIQENEPFWDVSYIRGRLVQLGILSLERVGALTQKDGITHKELPPADTLDLFGC